MDIGWLILIVIAIVLAIVIVSAFVLWIRGRNKPAWNPREFQNPQEAWNSDTYSEQDILGRLDDILEDNRRNNESEEYLRGKLQDHITEGLGSRFQS